MSLRDAKRLPLLGNERNNMFPSLKKTFYPSTNQGSKPLRNTSLNEQALRMTSR